MNFILTFSINYRTIRTGFDSLELANRARVRALAQGADYAEVA